MSRLLLLRHAKAEWAGPGMGDRDRALKGRGRRNAEAIAKVMLEADLLPDLVICSKARRALETWEIVSHVLRRQACRVQLTDALYGTDAPAYLRTINEAPLAENLMLVGHNPMMEDIALALSGKGNRDALAALDKGFPTCGLAVISFADSLESAGPGKGRLERFITPADLERNSAPAAG